MFRFARPTLSFVCAAALSTVALAACSGSQQSATPIVRAATSAPAPVASSPGSTSASTATASVTLSVTIPRKTAPTSRRRRPNYISANTEEIDLSMTSPNSNGVTGATQSGIVNVTNCPNLNSPPAAIVCTFSFIEPLGSASFLIVANDGTAASPIVVAQQQFTQTLYAKPTTLAITLDAVIDTLDTDGIAVTPTGACPRAQKCIFATKPSRTAHARHRFDSTTPDLTVAGSACSVGPDPIDGPADLSTTCGVSFDATGTSAFAFALYDPSGDSIAPGVAGYPTVTLSSSNPTTFAPTLSADGTTINIAASGTGEAVITVSVAGASATDNIATQTLKFAVGYGALYDADSAGGGILALNFPLATAGNYTIDAGGCFQNLAFDSSDNLYATQCTPPSQFDIFYAGGNGGEYASTPDATNTNVGTPMGIAFYPSGELFVTDDANGILGFTPPFTGTPQSADTSNSVGSYEAPSQLAFDSSANAYIPDSQANTIDYVVAGQTPPYAVPYTLETGAYPAAVAFYGNEMFVVESGRSEIAIYSTSAAFLNNPTTPATAVAIQTPNGIAFDAIGDMFVATGGNGSIVEYAPPYTGAPIATIGRDTLGAVGSHNPHGLAISGVAPAQVP